jgi:hypothetical protein
MLELSILNFEAFDFLMIRDCVENVDFGVKRTEKMARAGTEQSSCLIISPA